MSSFLTSSKNSKKNLDLSYTARGQQGASEKEHTMVAKKYPIFYYRSPADIEFGVFPNIFLTILEINPTNILNTFIRTLSALFKIYTFARTFGIIL